MNNKFEYKIGVRSFVLSFSVLFCAFLLAFASSVCGSGVAYALSASDQTANLKPVANDLSLKTTTEGNCLFTHAEDDENYLQASSSDYEENPNKLKVMHIYRLYNPITSEHLFSNSISEYNVLTDYYWVQEGKALDAYSASSVGVYRLYNKDLGGAGRMSHHYTTSKEEADNLVAEHGWVYDNDGEPIYYSAVDSQGNPIEGSSPAYRLYHDGLSAHHITLSKEESDNLQKYHGWQYEGISFWAYSDASSVLTNENGKVEPKFTAKQTGSDQQVVQSEKSYKVTVLGNSGAIECATVTADSSGDILVSLPPYTENENLRIYVKDEENLPLANVKVTVNDSDGEMRNIGTTAKNGLCVSPISKGTTKADGTTSPKNPSTYSEYYVSVKDLQGNTVQGADVEFFEDGTSTLTLPEGMNDKSVVITVLNSEDQSAVVSQQVTVIQADGTTRNTGETDESGSYTSLVNIGVTSKDGLTDPVNPAKSERYTVLVQTLEDGAVSQDPIEGATVFINDSGEITVTMPEQHYGSNVSVTVKDSSQTPVKDVKVTVLESNGDNRGSDLTDENGIVGFMFINLYQFKVDIEGKTYTYNKQQQRPAVDTYSSSQYVLDQDFEIEYGDNVKAGENAGSVTIRGINYYKGEVTYNFNIEKAPVKVTGGITAKPKVYDGSVNADLVTDGADIQTLYDGDEVTLTSATGYFEDANVVYKNGEPAEQNVILSDFVFGGADGANYEAEKEGNQETTSAIITPRTTWVTGGITASDKEYDATTDVEVDYKNATFDSLVSGDQVKVKSVKAEFDTKDVALDTNGNTVEKTVLLSNYEFTGDQLGNYTIDSDKCLSEVKAKIEPAPVSLVSGSTGEPYTGNEDDVLLAYTGYMQVPDVRLSGTKGNDKVIVTCGYEYFDDGTEIDAPTEPGDYGAVIETLSNEDGTIATNYRAPYSGYKVKFNISQFDYKVHFHGNGGVTANGEDETVQTITTGYLDEETGKMGVNLDPNSFTKTVGNSTYGMMYWTDDKGNRYYDLYSTASGDLTTTQNKKDINLYAHWTENELGGYWMAASKETTVANSSSASGKPNSSYNNPQSSVIKTQKEIQDDIKILKDKNNANYTRVKNEYEAYMANDTYHLYTIYGSNATDWQDVSSAETVNNPSAKDDNKYAEFRIINVGEHQYSTDSDQTDGSALTFQSTHIIPTLYNYNDQNVNDGGWANSLLRTKLVKGGEVYNKFSTSFTNDITPVQKTSNNGKKDKYNATTIKEDGFWLVSYCEMTGVQYENTTPVENEEGVQYSWFKTSKSINVSGSNPALSLKTRAGNDGFAQYITSTSSGSKKTVSEKASTYWLRSPNLSSNALFSAVTENGVTFIGSSATNYKGLSLAFAM